MNRLEVANQLRESGNWIQDRWGNFKSENGNYRIKMQARSIRLEKKTSDRWVRIRSAY